MSTPFFRLMGQIVVAVETWNAVPDVREKMSKTGGLTKDQVEQGKELVKTGEALAERRVVDGGEDRIAGHNLHVAIGELETWMQTVKSALRIKKVSDQEIGKVLDHSIHAHDHSVSVIAQSLRALTMLRTSEEIGQAYGERQRSLHDLVVRGKTLLMRASDCGDVLLATPRGVTNDKMGAEIKAHHEKMQAWVVGLGEAAAKVGDSPAVLGLLGYLPDGVGRPGGGTSFAVPLHQRAQRSAPDPDMKGNGSGWSIGRQGRNSENLGKGFIERTFE